MLVKDLMTTKVRAVNADANVRQAAKEMADKNVGVLPVARNGELVGMLTDRDITVRVVGEGLDPNNTPVERVMSSQVFTLSADEDVAEAGRKMRTQQVRRAPVTSGDDQLVGILSLGDLAVKGDDPVLSGEVLEGISRPSAPNLR